MNPKIIENFISDTQCNLLSSYLYNATNWENNVDPSWNERLISVKKNSDALFTIINDIRSRTEEQIKSEFGISCPLYTNLSQFVKWRIGDKIWPPHADGENEDGTQNLFYFRNYSSIIYLNDDYTGGEIIFPKINLTIQPKKGTLIFFPGTAEYLHGVKPVLSGVRFTIATFYTFNKRFGRFYD